MDFRVRYAKAALADLKAVMAWSWQRHPGNSEQFADALLKHVELLARVPFMGTRVPGYTNVRRLLHTPLHVYYRVHPERREVEILHFWHAARKPPKIF